jgi:hypothetical protein
LCVMVYEVAEPSPTFAAYLLTTTALSIATVLVRTEIPLPAPTARSVVRFRPDVVASLIAAPLAPVSRPLPLSGAKEKTEPLRTTPLLAVYVPAPENCSNTSAGSVPTVVTSLIQTQPVLARVLPVIYKCEVTASNLCRCIKICCASKNPVS